AHFSKLFDSYHEVEHEVRRIEEGVENTSDDYLDGLKKKRLYLKDTLYSMITA
ncbi:MAG: YdcH family protein, partial [Gammaproteobacteria bacterium]|nr:YdcH family protein [Gammaproteobacteria bacterium]